MTLRRAAAVIAAATAVLAAAPAQASRVETVVQDDALFLHGTDAQVAEAMQRTRALGFERVRLTAGWSVIAPHPDSTTRPEFDAADPAAYPDAVWDNLDRAVRGATAAGVKPMIDIAFWAPRWATTEPYPTGRPSREIDAAEFALFATAVARRYSGSWAPPAEKAQISPSEPPSEPNILEQLFGKRPVTETAAREPEAPEVLPAVDLFTLWNEPNHPGFVSPQWEQVDGVWIPRAADIYRAMVHAAYPAVKEAAPGARVLIGATASMGSSEPNKAGVPPLRFLRRLACVDDRFRPDRTGACADFRPLPGDGWSHHPYSLQTTPDIVPEDADKAPVGATSRLTSTLRRLVLGGRLAPANANVYMTEYGYETRPHDPRAPFTAEQQPQLLAWAEAIATADPSVRMWPQFQLYDRPEEPAAGERRWSDWQSGLFDAAGEPKPGARDYGQPIHTRCVRKGKRRLVEVWGRLRGASGTPTATVERVGGGATARVASAPSAGATVRRRVRHRRGARYRLRWSHDGGTTTSAVSEPVGCRKKRR